MPVNSFKWKHFVGEIILLNVRFMNLIDYSKYKIQEANSSFGIGSNNKGLKIILNSSMIHKYQNQKYCSITSYQHYNCTNFNT